VVLDAYSKCPSEHDLEETDDQDCSVCEVRNVRATKGCQECEWYVCPTCAKIARPDDVYRLVGNVWDGGADFIKQNERIIEGDAVFKKLAMDGRLEVRDTSKLKGWNPNTHKADGEPVDSRYNYHQHLKNAIATELLDNKVVILDYCYSLETFHEMKLSEHNDLLEKEIEEGNTPRYTYSTNLEAFQFTNKERETKNIELFPHGIGYRDEKCSEHNPDEKHRCPIYRNFDGVKRKMQCEIINQRGIELSNTPICDLAKQGFGDLGNYPMPIFDVPNGRREDTDHPKWGVPFDWLPQPECRSERRIIAAEKKEEAERIKAEAEAQKRRRLMERLDRLSSPVATQAQKRPAY